MIKCKSGFQDTQSSIWDILSISAICIGLYIFIMRWEQLPFFLDMYYHMAVAKGFEAANGIVGHNFWEYGPKGIPHIYPPILPIIMLILLKAGISYISIMRLLSCVLPVLTLISLCYIIKKILNKRVSFFVLFLTLCASIFMVSLSFTPSATLGIILFMFGAYFLYKKNDAAAILIFGLIFYTHTGIAIISLFFIIISWAFRIIDTKSFLQILLASLAIGSLWLFHTIKSMHLIQWQNTSNMPIRIYPIILLLFAWGIIKSLGRSDKTKLLFAIILSLIPMGFLYPFRFVCAQGMLAFLIFAGIGLDSFYSSANSMLKKIKAAHKYRLFLFLIMLLCLILFSPSLQIGKNRINFRASDSLPAGISIEKNRTPDYLYSTIYNKPFIENLAEYVKDYSNEGEFIWSNYRYITGILWIITHRPSISTMLLEIRGRVYKSDINNASLLIIIDEPGGEFNRIYDRIKGLFDIASVKKNEGVDIFILTNKRTDSKKYLVIPNPIIGLHIAVFILSLYLIVLLGAITYHHKNSV